MNAIEIVKKQSRIKEFNPVQKLALENGLLENQNLVVSSPTASGKTLIAEIAIINNWLKKLGKAIYIVPLRALAYEKYDEFKEKYATLGLKIGVSTGDFDSTSDYLENKDLIILTSEKLDSLMRHKAGWLSQISLVIADEVHLITEQSRGPTLEIVLTLLKENLAPQIIALSATISNADEIANWLNANLVISDYRPIPLEKGIFYDGQLILEDKNEEVERDLISFIKRVVKNKKQILVFLSSRRNTESFAEKLAKEFPLISNDLAKKVLNVLESPTKQCKKEAECLLHGVAFHHAGLLDKQRKLIERGFREGKINVICATTTLCLTGDTKIQLADGTTERIENLFRNYRNAYVFSFNGSEFEKAKIINTGRRSTKELIELETDSGEKIKCTKNHPFLVLDEGEIKWKRADQISEKDFLALATQLKHEVSLIPLLDLLPENIRIYNKELVRKILDTLLKKYKNLKSIAKKYNIKPEILWYYRGKNSSSFPFKLIKQMSLEAGINIKPEDINVISSGSLGCNDNKIRIPPYVDSDFMKFLGLLFAEGSITKKTSWSGKTTYLINFTNSNQNLIKCYKELVEKLFNLKPKLKKSKYGEVYNVSVISKLLGEILLNCGLKPGRKSNSFAIPSKFFKLSNDSLRNFLKYLFYCDGYINREKNCIEFYTISKNFLYQIKTLLLRFGIKSYAKKRKSHRGKLKDGRIINPRYKRIFRLCLYGRDSERFRKLILGEKIKFKKKTFHGDRIYIKKTLRRFLEANNLSTYKARKLTGIDVYDWCRNEIPLKESVQKFIKKIKEKGFKKDIDELERLVNLPIMWAKVKNVKNIRKETYVYNLEVEGNHNFIANNLIVHNSAGLNLPAFLVIIKDTKRYTGGYSQYLPNFEVQQMLGRGGRPKFDKTGLAILVAKNPGEIEELRERYLFGEIEPITSKLAIEPVLRMHALSLIASEFVHSFDSLLNFFKKTFFGYTYRENYKLQEIIEKVLFELEEFGFIDLKNFRATRIGKRVAELYLDPLSANKILQAIEKASVESEEIFWLQTICYCSELYPPLKVKSKEIFNIDDFIAKNEEKFLVEIPNPWDYEYTFFQDSLKTALMLKDWIEEKSEEAILEKYSVTPGELYTKKTNSEWLLYAAQELAKLKGKRKLAKELRKLEIRVKNGVKEELLNLIKIKGIGRVKARRLYNFGIKRVADIKKFSKQEVEKLIGKKILNELLK